MRFFSGWTSRMKARLGTSSLEDWSSFLENSPAEETKPATAVSSPEVIGLTSLPLRGLLVACICYGLFLLGVASACILLISWATVGAAFGASSTAVSHSESDLGIWMGRKPFCYQLPQCVEWNNYSLEGRSSLRFETQQEVRTWDS